MCHLCYQLNGLKISAHGQAVPCDCAAGDKWRSDGRRQAAIEERLGMKAGGQSLVLPWTGMDGRTEITQG